MVQLARDLPSELPALIGGIQRGVVHSWVNVARPVIPTVRTLRAVLEALRLDPAPYAEFLSERGGYVECLCRQCLAEVETRSAQGLPEPARDPVWLWKRSQLNRAIKRHKRNDRWWQLPKREDGTIEWPCAHHIRAGVGRENFLRLNRPGRRRGRDRRARLAPSKNAQHRAAIAQAHVVNTNLKKPFNLCRLCDLAIYAREWHLRCWLTWVWYCRRQGMNDSDRDVLRMRRRGRDPARSIKRNYELALRHALAEREKRVDAIRAPRRRGRPRKLRSTSSRRKAITAFLRVMPGGWDLVFTKSDKGYATRQRAIPLPDRLQPLIQKGARDPLIRRLYRFEMKPEYIAHLTGTTSAYVDEIIQTSRGGVDSAEK